MGVASRRAPALRCSVGIEMTALQDTYPDIGEVLITAEQIAAEVGALAGRINEDYAGRRLLLVGVLTGAVVFLSDLMRRLAMPVLVEFIELSSYDSGTVSSGDVQVRKDLRHDISGHDVLVVEDIVDTGHSLRAALDLLEHRGAASVRSACLLSKPSRRVVDVTPDYVAFEIPDRFVVGYGLDCDQQYRNLPYILALRQR
jgi:hypoxanthine phosphoribosyltransferase